MSVELMPATQLGFNRPLTTLVRRTLHIHNPHPHPIAFKVKTTAPKQYCVRPNSGRVEVGETVEVSVLLQPLAQDPPPHAKCKDKFLVQSAFITPDEEMRSLGEMWSNVEKADKSAIHEQKLKCVYLPAEDGTTNANGIPEESEEIIAGSKTPQNQGEQSRMMDESPHKFGDGLTRWTTTPEKEYNPSHFRNQGYTYYELPQRVYTPPRGVLVDGPIKVDNRQIYTAAVESPTHAGSGLPTSKDAHTPIPITSTPIPAPPKPSDTPVATSPTPTVREDKSIPSLSAADTGAVSPTNVALEKSLDVTTKPEDKLELALQEIEKLKIELEQARGPSVTGLRKRGGVSIGGSGAETAVEKVKDAVIATGNTGVPVEVVAGLVVGVFVLTYLFF